MIIVTSPETPMSQEGSGQHEGSLGCSRECQGPGCPPIQPQGELWNRASVYPPSGGGEVRRYVQMSGCAWHGGSTGPAAVVTVTFIPLTGLELVALDSEILRHGPWTAESRGAGEQF